MASLALYITAWLILISGPLLRRGMEVTMLDIGQGDCICVQGPKHQNYLIDGGSSDVKEIQKYTLENVYSAAVMYDYKAVLIDPEKNVIGFAADGNNGENYYVFSYNDTNGFECLMNETVNGNGYQSARGVYVDNTLYVVKGNIIEAYDMADYQKTGDLIL